MSRPGQRHPSPALIVAMIALVAALSGSAIALPGRGSVGKNDLGRGVVTERAIARDAVTGKAVDKNGLTGSDVNESTFGRVPSASAAAHATTTDELDTGALHRVAIGQTVTIMSRGPFTLRLSCQDTDADADPEPALIAGSSENGSAWGYAGAAVDLDLDTGESVPVPFGGELTAASFSPGVPFAFAAPSGRHVQGSFSVGGKGPVGSGNGCFGAAAASG